MKEVTFMTVTFSPGLPEPIQSERAWLWAVHLPLVVEEDHQGPAVDRDIQRINIKIKCWVQFSIVFVYNIQLYSLVLRNLIRHVFIFKCPLMELYLLVCAEHPVMAWCFLYVLTMCLWHKIHILARGRADCRMTFFSCPPFHNQPPPCSR